MDIDLLRRGAADQASLVEYPVLLGRTPVKLMAYPVEASIAEKFQAMVELDLRNSRMKDFYDIWNLSRTLSFDLQTLSHAIRATFARRQTPIPTVAPAALTVNFSRPNPSATVGGLRQAHRCN